MVGAAHLPSTMVNPPIITTANLVSVVPFDREELDAYSLTVVAMDSAAIPLSSSAVIFVTVVDQNDNRPLFSSNAFSFVLQEETLGNSSALPIHEFTVSCRWRTLNEMIIVAILRSAIWMQG